MSQASDRLTNLPNLLVSRREAEQKIKEQIEAGYQLRSREIDSRQALNVAYSDQRKWSEMNFEILRRYFDDDSVASHSMPQSIPVRGLNSLDGDVESFREYLSDSISRFESVVARLPLIPEITEHSTTDRDQSLSTNIFAVHGHDEAAKEKIARFIEKLNLHPIILHEQPTGGSKAIIEKLEANSDVGFAVVLLTPDDVGASRDKFHTLNPRARQNVILELGYFMGKLGRGRVCVLYKEGVEIPSDYQGVLYIPMDSDGAWRMALAQEFKNAGIEVDLNKI